MSANIDRPTRDKAYHLQHVSEQKRGNKQFCISPSARTSAVQFGDQHSSRKYVQVNNQSCVWIKSGLVKQAVEMLQNCHKQIQKNLDDSTWNAILHNLSGAYQKLTNFSKSLEYLRILLHNMNIKMPKHEEQCDFQTRVSQFSIQLTLAKYYINFLVLALELHMLEAASIPINRIFQFFRKFTKDYRKSGLALTLINTKMSEHLLSQIEQFETVFNKSSQWQVYDTLKQAALKVQKIPFTEISASKIRKFTVANLTQISPFEMTRQNGKAGSKHIGHRMFQNGLIEFAVALFLIGKSQFQSVSSKYKDKDDDFNKLAALDKCKMYVVWSLYFCCQLCPYFTPLHQEIYNFYEKNLQISTGSQYKSFKSINPSMSSTASSCPPWQIVKRHFTKLSELKDEKRQERTKKHPSSYLLNQQNLQEAIQACKQRQQTKQNSISISYNRIKRNHSLQLFQKQRQLFRKQTRINAKSQQKRRTEKVSGSVKKMQIRRNQPNINPINLKLNTKSKRKDKQKSQNSIQSMRSLTSASKSSKKNKKTTNHEKDLDGVFNQYYVKPQKINKNTIKNDQKQGKELVNNYLHLEKKIKQSSRSLSKKKNALLNRIKKL